MTHLSEMAFSCRFQKGITPPPPFVVTCLHLEAKVVKNPQDCQNAQSWHIMNEAERSVNMGRLPEVPPPCDIQPWVGGYVTFHQR